LWTCPNYCGTNDGTYEDMTTLWYRNTYFEGDDTWNRQVHVFVRNGIKVPRLIEGTTDSSNNMLDLAIYLIRETSRVPELLIDTTAMTLAANFTATNKFYWDGVITESSNLEDWMQRMAGFFLLRVSDKNGKKGFRPRLPINANYTINTGVISWVYGFTEEHLLPDGFQIEYIPLTERKPICTQMIWRQQPPNDIGFIRTTEVRIDGEAVDGPYEQFDMSQFCTWEDHAVKVGAYEVARRKYVTHSLRIKVKPDSFNTTLVLGDIVRVQLRRETDPGLVTFHDYLYEVEKINKTISGVVELDLMHFPIDSQGRSILALYVAGAEGTGYLYDVGRNDYACDDPDNEGNDDPLPTDVGENNPDEPDTDVDLPNPGVDDGTGTGLPTDRPVFPGGTPTTGYPPSGSPTGNNADDPFDTDTPGGGGTIGGIPVDRPLLPGDELTYTPPCCPAEVKMYAIDYDTGERLQEAPVAIGTAIVGDCEVRFEIFNEYLFDTATAFEFTHRCVDPGSPDGYGAELPGGKTPAVEGKMLIGSPGIYSVSWTISQVNSCVGIGCNGKTNVRPASAIQCFTDPPQPIFGINYWDFTANYTLAFGVGPWGSVAYGIRAYNKTATLTIVCDNASSTVVDYLVIEILNSSGAWIKYAGSPIGGSNPTQANAGTALSAIDVTNLVFTTKAINIQLTEL
jgi:hypothetical protein